MHPREVPVSRQVIYGLLQGCTQKKDLGVGRHAHSLMVSNGLESAGFLGDHLIRLFALSGSLLEANIVFCKVTKPSVYTWHAIISAHDIFGESERAIALYHQMQQGGIRPDKFIFSCILKVCGSIVALWEGSVIHGEIIRSGLDTEKVVQTTLVDMYAKCGSLDEALNVFNKLSNWDAVLWGAMIAGYTQQGHGALALELFNKMLQQGIKPDQVTYLCILKACGSIGAIEQGRNINDHIITGGLESDVVVGNTLVNMYAKCSCLEDARKVFDELPARDMVSWGTMITGYARHGLAVLALEVLEMMEREGVRPDKVTFSCVLKACGMKGAIGQGRLIHDMILESGFESDVIVGNSLVDMYVKCESLEDAQEVFDKLKCRNVVSWNAMLAGGVQHMNGISAIRIFEKMQQDGVTPDRVTYLCILKVCSCIGSIGQGNFIHERIIQSGLDLDVILGNTLIDMYVKCGMLDAAYKVFKYLPSRNTASWSAVISGYAQNGHWQHAYELFKKMQCEGIEPDQVMFLSFIKVCSSSGTLQLGRSIHHMIINSGVELDVIIGNALIDMYAKHGSLKEAHSVFDTLLNRDVVSWGAMIAGYANQGLGSIAFDLFEKMQQEGLRPDEVVFLSSLKACGSIENLDQGMLLHERIARSGLDSDAVVGNALIDMYAKCGSPEQAHKIFEDLPNRDIVSWGAMITGYVQQGHGPRALELFEKMQQVGIRPDEVAFSCTLKACSSMGAVKLGTLIHERIIRSELQSEVVVGNALIDMYAKFGNLAEAHKVFDKLINRDLVSWNAMITAYVQHGHGLAALELFERMQEDDMKPDTVTFKSALKACSSIGSIRHGRLIHDYTIKCGVNTDTAVGNTLVNMYANCGILDEACTVFDRLQNRDMVSWNAMIAGYARLGSSTQLGQYLQGMQQEGFKPDSWTYTSILAACSHEGQVEEGHRYFKCMREDHSLTPSIEHFNCMIELLGSAGRVHEAEKLLQSMPILPDFTGWMTLLTACRTYGNAELGRVCFDQAIRLDPNNAANYVLMSNTYADVHMWEDVDKLRELRKGTAAWKKPGMAWIEVNRKVHEFIVTDKDHSQRDKIYFKLKELRRQMKVKGYMPQINIILEPIAEEENDLWESSGKICLESWLPTVQKSLRGKVF